MRLRSNAGGESLWLRVGKVIGETLGDDTSEDVAELVDEYDPREYDNCFLLYGRGKSCNSLKSYPSNGFRLRASSRKQS
jgi:hypothetical protein